MQNILISLLLLKEQDKEICIDTTVAAWATMVICELGVEGLNDKSCHHTNKGADKLHQFYG